MHTYECRVKGGHWVPCSITPHLGLLRWGGRGKSLTKLRVRLVANNIPSDPLISLKHSAEVTGAHVATMAYMSMLRSELKDCLGQD